MKPADGVGRFGERFESFGASAVDRPTKIGCGVSARKTEESAEKPKAGGGLEAAERGQRGQFID